MKLIRKSITGTISSEDLMYLQYLSNQSAYNPRGGDLNTIYRISAKILNGTNEPDKYVTIVDSKMTLNGEIVALAKYASERRQNTKQIDLKNVLGKDSPQYIDKKLFVTRNNNLSGRNIKRNTLKDTVIVPSNNMKIGIKEVCKNTYNLEKSKLFKKKK